MQESGPFAGDGACKAKDSVVNERRQPMQYRAMREIKNAQTFFMQGVAVCKAVDIAFRTSPFTSELKVLSAVKVNADGANGKPSDAGCPFSCLGIG